jgi:hypothetical protein
MTFFGDPLIFISFPVEVENNTEKMEENESWYAVSKQLARIASYLLKKQEDALEIREEILNSNDKETELSLLKISNILFLQNNEKNREYQLKKSVYNLFNYPSKRFTYSGLSQSFPNINTYLSDKGYKISRLLSSVVLSNLITDGNLFDQGWWEFEFILQDDFFGYVNYFFELEIYEDEELTIVATNSLGNIVSNFNSGTMSVGWSYEFESGDFRDIPVSGVSSSFIGRKIKYTSRKDSLITSINEYLTRGQVYYFKIRQYIEGGNAQYFEWRTYSDIIYT